MHSTGPGTAPVHAAIIIGAVTAALAGMAWAPAAVRAERPSQARSRPAAPADRQVPFAVGERLAYDIGWSAYLTAGSATMAVVETTSVVGAAAYRLVADGQPTPLLANLYPLYYKAETLLDTSSLLPHQGSLYSQEGRRRRTKTTRFDRKGGKVTFGVEGRPDQSTTLPMKPGTLDALSAFYALRSLSLEPGVRVTFPVADDGETFELRVTVNGRETLVTAAGQQPAWRLTPEILDAAGKPAADRRLALWLSDDARRLPLKIEADFGFGTFVLALRDASRSR